LRNLVIGALACVLSMSACSKIGDQTSAGGTTRGTGTIPGELRVAIQRSPTRVTNPNCFFRMKTHDDLASPPARNPPKIFIQMHEACEGVQIRE